MPELHKTDAADSAYQPSTLDIAGAIATSTFIETNDANSIREKPTKLYLKLHRRLTIAALRAGGQDA